MHTRELTVVVIKKLFLKQSWVFRSSGINENQTPCPWGQPVKPLPLVCVSSDNDNGCTNDVQLKQKRFPAHDELGTCKTSLEEKLVLHVPSDRMVLPGNECLVLGRVAHDVCELLNLLHLHTQGSQKA